MGATTGAAAADSRKEESPAAAPELVAAQPTEEPPSEPVAAQPTKEQAPAAVPEPVVAAAAALEATEATAVPTEAPSQATAVKAVSEPEAAAAATKGKPPEPSPQPAAAAATGEVNAPVAAEQAPVAAATEQPPTAATEQPDAAADAGKSIAPPTVGAAADAGESLASPTDGAAATEQPAAAAGAGESSAPPTDGAAATEQPAAAADAGESIASPTDSATATESAEAFPTGHWRSGSPPKEPPQPEAPPQPKEPREQRRPPPPKVSLRTLGEVVGRNVQLCSFYSHRGWCKYEDECRNHHASDAEFAEAARRGDGAPATPARAGASTAAAPAAVAPVPRGGFKGVASFASGAETFALAKATSDASVALASGEPAADGTASALPSPAGRNVSSSGEGVGSCEGDGVHVPTVIEKGSGMLMIKLGDGLYPVRPGVDVCQHFIKTGDCKWRKMCRHHHPVAHARMLMLACASGGGTANDAKSAVGGVGAAPDAQAKRTARSAQPAAEPADSSSPLTAGLAPGAKQTAHGKSYVELNGKRMPLRPGRTPCRNLIASGKCPFGMQCFFDHALERFSNLAHLVPAVEASSDAAGGAGKAAGKGGAKGGDGGLRATREAGEAGAPAATASAGGPDGPALSPAAAAELAASVGQLPVSYLSAALDRVWPPEVEMRAQAAAPRPVNAPAWALRASARLLLLTAAWYRRKGEGFAFPGDENPPGLDELESGRLHLSPCISEADLVRTKQGLSRVAQALIDTFRARHPGTEYGVKLGPLVRASPVARTIVIADVPAMGLGNMVLKQRVRLSLGGLLAKARATRAEVLAAAAVVQPQQQHAGPATPGQGAAATPRGKQQAAAPSAAAAAKEFYKDKPAAAAKGAEPAAVAKSSGGVAATAASAGADGKLPGDGLSAVWGASHGADRAPTATTRGAAAAAAPSDSSLERDDALWCLLALLPTGLADLVEPYCWFACTNGDVRPSASGGASGGTSGEPRPGTAAIRSISIGADGCAVLHSRGGARRVLPPINMPAAGNVSGSGSKGPGGAATKGAAGGSTSGGGGGGDLLSQSVARLACFAQLLAPVLGELRRSAAGGGGSGGGSRARPRRGDGTLPGSEWEAPAAGQPAVDPFMGADIMLVPGTLHRCVATRLGSGAIVGLTYRVGRQPRPPAPCPSLLLVDVLRTVVGVDAGGDGAGSAPQPSPGGPGPNSRPGQANGGGGDRGGACAASTPRMPSLPGLLIAGPACSGKTTMLRALTRAAALQLNKQVLVLDNSWELGGLPLHLPGDSAPSQPMTVADLGPGTRRLCLQHMLQQQQASGVPFASLVQSVVTTIVAHAPDVVVMDDMQTELEAGVMEALAQRGVVVLASSPVRDLSALAHSPDLASTCGLQTPANATAAQQAAAEQQAQRALKAAREGFPSPPPPPPSNGAPPLLRSGLPAFSALVELLPVLGQHEFSGGRMRVHLDLGRSVAALVTAVARSNSGAGGADGAAPSQGDSVQMRSMAVSGKVSVTNRAD
ncbi:hypothetical protein FOA52_011922 [Chlamydomonas sp. UWO 241]|nr:hypothetical protein FOA52_011922 [Chlamydomonas sp. UWO 241]